MREIILYYIYENAKMEYLKTIQSIYDIFYADINKMQLIISNLKKTIHFGENEPKIQIFLLPFDRYFQKKYDFNPKDIKSFIEQVKKYYLQLIETLNTILTQYNEKESQIIRIFIDVLTIQITLKHYNKNHSQFNEILN